MQTASTRQSYPVLQKLGIPRQVYSVQAGSFDEFYDAVGSLRSSVSSFVSTTAASIRASTHSFTNPTSAFGSHAPSNASQLSGNISRQASPLCYTEAQAYQPGSIHPSCCS